MFLFLVHIEWVVEIAIKQLQIIIIILKIIIFLRAGLRYIFDVSCGPEGGGGGGGP